MFLPFTSSARLKECWKDRNVDEFRHGPTDVWGFLQRAPRQLGQCHKKLCAKCCRGYNSAITAVQTILLDSTWLLAAVSMAPWAQNRDWTFDRPFILCGQLLCRQAKLIGRLIINMLTCTKETSKSNMYMNSHHIIVNSPYLLQLVSGQAQTLSFVCLLFLCRQACIQHTDNCAGGTGFLARQLWHSLTIWLRKLYVHTV